MLQYLLTLALATLVGSLTAKNLVPLLPFLVFMAVPVFLVFVCLCVLLLNKINGHTHSDAFANTKNSVTKSVIESLTETFAVFFFSILSVPESLEPLCHLLSLWAFFTLFYNLYDVFHAISMFPPSSQKEIKSRDTKSYVRFALNASAFSDFRRRIFDLAPEAQDEIGLLLEKADESYINKAGGKTWVWNNIDWRVIYGVEDFQEFDKSIHPENIATTFISFYAHSIHPRCVSYTLKRNDDEKEHGQNYLPASENTGEMPCEMTQRRSA